jgi:hypothetical protein
MRRSQRLIASAVLIALSGVLGGCSSGLSSWDPSDLLDFFDTKKKLPGDRKPVFPDGVPGLEQGVPKDLYKGASQVDQQNTQAVAVAPPEEPKSDSTKSKGKSKTKQPATASTAPAQDAADPNVVSGEDGSTAAAPPAPKPKKIVRQRTTAPPPDQQPDQSTPSAQAAQPPQQSASPFPAPVPGGTFSR